MFKSLDHIAILVQDVEEALTFYRDRLGLPVVIDEVIESGGVRLTHLDLGNLQLQLVQPLSQDHPLGRQLAERGEGLHHLCFAVDQVDQALVELREQGLEVRAGSPHQGPKGRQAAFVEPTTTRGVLWEITSQTPN